MSRVLAIAGRELRASFLTPGGYVITCLFVLAVSLIFCFAGVFEQGQVASLRSVFASGTWLLVLLCPAITMRSISEELRLGTFETLMTSPVSEAQVVLGKFLGSMGFLVALLAPTLMYVIALELYGRPDYGELACGYLGMLLAGAAYLASGILASSLTGSQVVAYLLTVFFWLSFSVAASQLPSYLPDQLAVFAMVANPGLRLNDFAIGLIDTSNIVYFASFAAIFLLAAVMSLSARRWP